jgi:hypothetical protein
VQTGWLEIFMDIERLEPLHWQPEDYFARAADRRGLTPEQLRAQLRGLADQASANANHISFEHLRDGALSDKELTHLDACHYCSQFLQTVNPQPGEVERFVKRATRWYGIPQHVVARRWAMPLTLAAVLSGGVGVTAYQVAKHNTVSDSTAAPVWASTVTRCEDASGKTIGCQIFADAARYQVAGDTQTAQSLVTRGLVKAGVSKPVVAKVEKTLNAPRAPKHELPEAVAKADAAARVASREGNVDASQWLETARLHVVAGQQAQAYSAVGNYLKASVDNSQATAYVVGFAQPVSVYRASFTKWSEPAEASPSPPSKPAEQDPATAGQSEAQTHDVEQGSTSTPK